MTPQHIRERRANLRLSQSALSRLARVSRFKLNVFEAGGQLLTADELKRVEEALKSEFRKARAHLDQIAAEVPSATE